MSTINQKEIINDTIEDNYSWDETKVIIDVTINNIWDDMKNYINYIRG